MLKQLARLPHPPGTLSIINPASGSAFSTRGASLEAFRSGSLRSLGTILSFPASVSGLSQMKAV